VRQRENRKYQLVLEEKAKEQTQLLEGAWVGSIRALAETLEAKDAYTYSHSQRVVGLCLMTARKLGLNADQTGKLAVAAQLHDIGKIGVRDAVLNKPSALTPEEYQHILSHFVLGEKILRPMLREEDGLAMVKHHHERCDGRGFPDGLNRGQIPFGARILAVADAYDAMTSERPYRTALPHQEACARLQQAAGSQFDPQIVEAFLDCVNGNGNGQSHLE